MSAKLFAFYWDASKTILVNKTVRRQLSQSVLTGQDLQGFAALLAGTPAGQPTAPSPHGSSLLLPSQHGNQNNKPPSDQRSEIMLRICNIDWTVVIYAKPENLYHSLHLLRTLLQHLHTAKWRPALLTVSGFRVSYFKCLGQRYCPLLYRGRNEA